MRSCSIRGVVRHRLAWLVLILCSWRVAAAQDQPAPKTDSVEAAALNTILGRWGKKASLEWNISGELCSGFASAEIDWDYYPTINPFIKCDCSFSNNTLCHITKLRVTNLGVVGQIPTELQNLTHLEDLQLASNRLSGPLPKELGNLTNLLSLGINLNNFSGELPEEVGNMTKLQQLYIYSSGFSGPFPSTISKLKNLKLLKASDNEFTGKLLDYVGSLTKLEELDLSFNNITGQLP